MSFQQRKVFILNEGAHDYSGAEAFGELVYCTSGLLPKSDINRLFIELDKTLAESDSHDLIMLSSLSSLCAVASAIMAAQHGEVHFLIYHEGRYIEKDLML